MFCINIQNKASIVNVFCLYIPIFRSLESHCLGKTVHYAAKPMIKLSRFVIMWYEVCNLVI